MERISKIAKSSDQGLERGFSTKVRKDSLAWKSTWQLSLLSIPGFVWFLIFSYIPMFGIIIAFKDFNYRMGILASKWVGFDNFVYLFSSNDAVRILRNTICYNISFIIIGTICGVCTALLLDSMKKRVFIKVYQTAIFLPHFISWVVVAYMTQALFAYDGGIINNLLKSFGKVPVTWYTEPRPWPVILVIVQLWKTIGFNTLIYYGSIIGIDSSLYEAAAIDGASKFQMIKKITLPMIKPTVIILFLMSVGNMMRADFGLFYYITNNDGALYTVADVIDTYIYRILKLSGDITGSSAASVFQSVVGLFLVLMANGIVKKYDAENSLF